jgi:acyl carrier protein
MEEEQQQMSEYNIEREIIAIISEISGVEEDMISPQSHLANDLEIDSIKAIEIIVAIEKKYKIAIRDEDISQIKTLQEILSLVKSLTKPTPSHA